MTVNSARLDVRTSVVTVVASHQRKVSSAAPEPDKDPWMVPVPLDPGITSHATYFKKKLHLWHPNVKLSCPEHSVEGLTKSANFAGTRTDPVQSLCFGGRPTLALELQTSHIRNYISGEGRA